MADRSSPPSRRMPPSFPTAVLTSAIRAQRPEYDPRLRGEPYTVNIVPSVRGSVMLVGYDGTGEVVVEFRIPRARYQKRMADRLARWIRENDQPPLVIVP